MSKQSSTGQKVARATSAAVNIARGAAAGGVYGAAFEAAKSFLPELLKLFVILLFIVILVPMLIFTAIPNILFGYGSSSDQDIIDFTASAEELGSRYQQLDAYHEPVLQRLVNNILPNFWSDGSPLYDDYDVTEDMGNINQYWIMAIGSVRYKQDLYSMNESAIEDLMYDRLTYDVAQWSVENGYRCEGNGSYHSLIPDGGAHYGLTVTGIGNNSKKLVEALQEGKLVIAIMTKGHFTSSGHFIVLRGVTEDGNILVADPASVKRSNQEWALGIITNEASRRAGSGGPFWVMSK